MSSTFAARLAAGDVQRLQFYITIQGVPDVFQTSPVSLPSTIEPAARPRRKTLYTPRQGGSRLDLDRRRMVGGSLSFEIAEDDSGTLAALFASRKFRATWISADISKTATTVTVGSTAGMTSSGAAYCGGETFTYTGTTATTLTGVTRGVYRSAAQTHFGSTLLNGEAVFTSPPTWFGRRVYLYAYFENPDGSTSANLTQQVGTFSIEAAPTYGGRGTWQVSCSELSDEIGKKIVGQGLKKYTLKSREYIGIGGTGNLNLEDGALSLFAVGSDDTYLLRTCGDANASFERITAVNASSLTLDTTITYASADNPMGAACDTVQHVAIVTGSPALIAAKLAMSVLGNNGNGGQDVLPGREHDDPSENEWFFGARIPSSEVNVPSLVQFTDDPVWRYTVAEPHPLEEALFDLCFVLRGFWFVDRLGVLRLRRIEPSENSVGTFDSSNIDPRSPPLVELDESGIFPRASVQTNYNPVTGKFDAIFNYEDPELCRTYPNIAQVYEFKSRVIRVFTSGFQAVETAQTWANGDPYLRTAESAFWIHGGMHFLDVMTHEQAGAMIVEAVHRVARRPRAIITLATNLSQLNVEIGDVVTVTAAVPDLEGRSSLTARRAMVVGKEPRWDSGTIEWRLSLLADTVVRIAPGVIIQSASTSTLTLRVRSSSFPEAADATPGRMFAVGQTVRLFDESAGTTETRTVSSVTDTTITLNSAPSFSVQNDVDYVVAGDQLATGATQNTNASGYSEDDYAYQIPNDEQADATKPPTRLL